MKLLELFDYKYLSERQIKGFDKYKVITLSFN